jgi:hypothetical protein
MASSLYAQGLWFEAPRIPSAHQIGCNQMAAQQQSAPTRHVDVPALPATRADSVHNPFGRLQRAVTALTEAGIIAKTRPAGTA